MRLSIDHRTTYRFSTPQDRLVQRLRMRPDNTHDQTAAHWHIAVDCDARMREHRDGFGNAVTMLYCDGPIASIEVSVSGEVVTSHSDGVLHGTNEPLPPAVFLQHTPVTQHDEAIAHFAEAAAGDANAITRLHRLNAAVVEHIALTRDRPLAGRTARDTLRERSGTVRDRAHLFIAAARSLGVPARFVGGYCDLIGDRRAAPHGWADAHVPGLGWVGFDPTLGLSPEEHHVRVAVALDAAGAAPVSGSRLGEGEEKLDVQVDVHGEA